MSGCGCAGHHHDIECPEQNTAFWEPGRAPVMPSPEEIRQQKLHNFARLPHGQQAAFLSDSFERGDDAVVPLRAMPWPV